jgi:hypothetical protein
MKTVFDKYSDANAEYCRPTEHFAVIVHFKDRVVFIQYISQKQTVWDKNLQAM